jgi:hypothetical protein
MTRIKVTSLVKVSLLVLCAVALSLAAFHPASAKSRIDTAARGYAALQISTGKAINVNATKRAALRIILREAKINPKLAKALATKCGCTAAAQQTGAFGSCFKSCLQRHGISAATIASCGAICSVNLVGCAICAGVSEWVIMGCAQYCVWWGGSSAFDDPQLEQILP